MPCWVGDNMAFIRSDTTGSTAKPLFGIRFRLMLFALLVVVPLTLDRVRVTEASRSERIEDAASEMTELARRGAEQQNEMIITVRAVIQAAARSYVTASAPLGEQCSTLLRSFIRDIPWVTTMSVVNADGKIVCSTGSRILGVDVSDRSYFRRALSSSEFVMSDYVIARGSGMPRIMASYATTSKELESVVVVAALSLEWMGGFASLVSRRPGVVVDLVDANGIVLAHYPHAADITVGQDRSGHPLAAALLAQKEGYVTTNGFDGTRRIYGYVSLPWTNARLAVGLSKAEILESVDRELFIAYGQLAFFGLLALLVAWFAGEKLFVSPIRALAARAERFGRGEFDAPMQTISWIAEFQALAGAFDDMAKKLAERESDLRTANLHLTQLATIDELSGLANRRGFDARLEAEWQLAAELRRPIALLMIDVDHFKLFNDHYGHLEGDHCLRGIGEVLRKNSRGEADFPARYGGEEFVLLLPGGSLEKALHLAEQLRRTVESLSFANSQSPWGFVTISVGAASLVPDDTDTAEKLVEAADAGLYAAKRRGRNTVVIHDPVVLSEAC
jgi:diguanylate cyclase (GGDEF)-like protein